MKDNVVINMALHKYAECWELGAELSKELDRVLSDYAYGGFDVCAFVPSATFNDDLNTLQAQISNGEYIGKADKLVILCNAIKASQERFDNVGGELQGQSGETATGNIKKPFPKELDTEEWQKVLPKLIEKGFVTDTPQGYRWQKSNVLFAYLVGRVYCCDYPNREDKYNKVTWEKGNRKSCDIEPLPCEILKEYWGINNISEIRSHQDNCPRGYKDIDKLFG